MKKAKVMIRSRVLFPGFLILLAGLAFLLPGAVQAQDELGKEGQAAQSH